ncbi:SAM-dependent methyltransferase [Veronia nyctiphanis]|uniref:SAM-dependent methyltransferase n=1 Tax=Veronia nyctiphanis TaxID=1278244 RepID=A0A4Q0YSE3_9GAMM|nr:class I SAM-dependent methyltransferase [Veronia nyctiphanis]RXJ74066.1 SAM-dependent methyltransferase [Veronia nyctiphanis]
MSEQSQRNKEAWNYRAYEFWCKKHGKPQEYAARLLENRPNLINSRYVDYFKDVKDKRILNALGSNGRKAVPLCLLGAEVTIIDISEENKQYALELAHHANVELCYEIADFIEYQNDNLDEYYDIVFCEGGILHYFSDLDVFFKKVSRYLRTGGTLILNDFHPFRKIASTSTGTGGNYFDDEVRAYPVAYENQFDEMEQKDFPKCSLRFYQLGEIVTAVGQNRMHITELRELPKTGEETVLVSLL